MLNLEEYSFYFGGLRGFLGAKKMAPNGMFTQLQIAQSRNFEKLHHRGIYGRPDAVYLQRIRHMQISDEIRLKPRLLCDRLHISLISTFRLSYCTSLEVYWHTPYPHFNIETLSFQPPFSSSPPHPRCFPSPPSQWSSSSRLAHWGVSFHALLSHGHAQN